MRPPKLPLYVLPHGIEVIGEYAPTAKNPYWRVRVRPHPLIVGKIISNGICTRRSRVVAAAKLGRIINANEHAHHEIGKVDDSLKNIEVLSAAEHNRHHKTGSTHRPESRAQTSETLKRLYATGAKVPSPVLGSKQWCAKLTEQQAACIKHSTEKTRVLADRYGISKTIVKQIRNGKLWRHVK